MMMSFVALGVVGIAWAVIGYSLAFAPGYAAAGRTLARAPPQCRPRAAGHHPARALHVVPGHVRHHHGCADLRRDRRAHAVQRLHAVHHAVVDRRLCAGRALGLGRRLAGQPRRARFRRRHRRARERRRRGARRGARARPAQGLRAAGLPAAQRAVHAARRRAALVRVVRVQRRQRARREPVGRARVHHDVSGADGHARRLDAARHDAQPESHRRWRRHGHRRRPRGDHAGRGVHQPDQRDCARRPSPRSRATSRCSGASARDWTTRSTSWRRMDWAAPSARC